MPLKVDFWSFVTSRIFFAIAGLAVVGIGIGVVKGIVRRVEIEREISTLHNEIRNLESKNEEMRRLITYFSTPEFKEREARLRLGLQKPGENVVVIPNVNTETSKPDQTLQNPALLPNWQHWFNYFFGR